VIEKWPGKCAAYGDRGPRGRPGASRWFLDEAASTETSVGGWLRGSNLTALKIGLPCGMSHVVAVVTIFRLGQRQHSVFPSLISAPTMSLESTSDRKEGLKLIVQDPRICFTLKIRWGSGGTGKELAELVRILTFLAQGRIKHF
jgi:hypothetical protein